MASRIRVIEYEILSWDDLLGMEHLAELVNDKIGMTGEIGLLHCTVNTTKVTLVGTAEATRELIASGRASKPGGLVISKAEFPILIQGWPYRFGPR